jgi:hypothetical protein
MMAVTGCAVAFTVLVTLATLPVEGWGDKEGALKALQDIGEIPNNPAPETYWYPNEGSPREWPIVFPEICATRVVNATPTNKLPGFASKRIALALRGDAFRGLSFGTGSHKHAFYCTAEAHAIQKAMSAAHVEYLVKPMEAAGYAVDIYLATYGCTNMPNVSRGEAKRMHSSLISWYRGGAGNGNTAGRTVYHELVDRQPGQNQSTGMQSTMRLLARTMQAGLGSAAPAEYQSVLLWRLDVLPLVPMEPPAGDAVKPLAQLSSMDLHGSLTLWSRYRDVSGTYGLLFGEVLYVTVRW